MTSARRVNIPGGEDSKSIVVGLAETRYRLAALAGIPRPFKVHAQWRVSVPKFEREVHSTDPEPMFKPSQSRLAVVDSSSTDATHLRLRKDSAGA